MDAETKRLSGKLDVRRKMAMAALGISLLSFAAPAGAVWMSLLLPIAETLSLKLMEISVNKEEKKRGIGDFGTGPTMKMIQPDYLLRFDESIMNAFPDLNAEEYTDLKMEIEGSLESGKTKEEKDELMSALLTDLDRIAMQRKKLKAMPDFERVRMAAENGSQCGKLNKGEAESSMKVLESKLSPWPKDASGAWVEMCKKSLQKNIPG